MNEGPAKRSIDILLGSFCLLASAPLIVFGALGVALSSRGPVIYRAQRVGRDGRVFEMLKLRTMHGAAGGAVITGHRDPRVFAFGRLIRATKIDELPQFLNVVRGEMSMVGPRPEDPGIVARHYTAWMHETLAVRPGVTSPGAIFYYGDGERLIDPADPEGSYAGLVLRAKLAVDRAYLERATVFSDLAILFRTGLAVLTRALGIRVSAPAVDLARARNWVAEEAFSGSVVRQNGRQSAGL